MSGRTFRPVGDRPGRPGEHRNSEAQIRTLLDDQKEQILAECQARINQHEFQAARAEEEQRLLQGQLLQQNLEFREAHSRSLTEMEELRNFQSSTFDTIARRKLAEDQNTFFGTFWPNTGTAEPQRRAARYLGHTWYIGKRFLQIQMRHHQHLILKNCISGISSSEEPLHSSTVEKSERQKQDQDLRCQSGPSAKNSVISSGGDSSKNYGADQQRLQISDLHFHKFPTPATFACWKMRFKTEVCTCSQFPTEAMQ